MDKAIGEIFTFSTKQPAEDVRIAILHFIDKRGFVPTQLDIRSEVQDHIDATILQQLNIHIEVRDKGLAPGVFYLW